MNDTVRIVEVGPRDGLQNEAQSLSLESKIQLIQHLVHAGLSDIEVAAFVNPKKVPQMADGVALCQQLPSNHQVTYHALVPNTRGLEDCLRTPIRHIGVLTAASETFCQKNLDCSIAESLNRIRALIPLAQERQCSIRAYISCGFGCPDEGHIPVQKVHELASQLMALGCDEISIGDTIGVATPKQSEILFKTLKQNLNIGQLAAHFHDTYGQALANIYAALEQGVRIIDSSVGGLGGCPYAHGATGNVATEEVVYMLEGSGFKTGVNLDELLAVSDWITQLLNRPTSRITRAKRRASHE